MITVKNLSQNFTQRTLFKDVTLSIFPNEKIGLTGPNGAGKTTLFSIILGEMEPTGGKIQRQKNLNIGYLPQEAKFTSERTVLEEVTSGDRRIQKLLEEKHALEDANKADSMRYGDVLHDLEQLGIYGLEHKAEKILSGLGFNERDFHRPILELSGGWQMRTLLAKLLVYPYDLLLLDEPTNYLDLSATIWLKEFLSGYNGTFIIISHDKVFLNDVTNYTIILENGQINKVKGNYQAYEEQKEIEQKGIDRRQKVVEKKKRQLEQFTRRFHAQPNRAAAVRAKRKMIERLNEETVNSPYERKSIGEFEFPRSTQSGYTVVTASKISKSYGETKVYWDIDFELIRGQKVCFVGPNGAGKSTLLKMLAGILKPDTGSIKLGHQVGRGYFSQTRLDILNPNRNVLDELASAVKGSYPAQQMRNLLGLFNFHGEDVFKMVKVLSGGEKSRLILTKLLINPPNFILLDEPTTHLDIDGVEALTKAFKKYEGTLCFISHDLFFLKEVADCVIEIDSGQLKIYPGGLDYYLHKKAAGETLSEQGAKAKKELKHKQKSEKKKNRDKENAKLNEARQKHKQALKRVSQIKKEIKILEAENKQLETETYVKSRFLSKSFGKDAGILKEYGKRLKEILKRQREIATAIKELTAEKNRITK
jgi:ATP-binding cassette subfamily F protein 3